LSNVVDEHLTIFYLLSLYPQLVDLDFASAYPVPDDVAEKQLLNLSNQKTLKSLRLDVPVVTPAYIRYITYFTAPDMDTIRLKMSRTNFFNWIDNMGSDTVIQLAQRMSKASNACISTYARSEQRPFQCNRSKMTRFYQILHALKGSRQLQCQGVFAECHSSEVLINIHQNYFLEFEYSLNSQDFEDGDGEDDDVGLVLPDRSISRIGPEIINSCSFQLSRRVKCVPHSLVKTALMHCPYLYHFQVKYNTHTFGALLEAGTPSTNRIKKIQQTTDQITQLLFKKGTVLSKKLTLILVKYLPNINVCKFNEVQLLTERVSLNSIIDLSGFKHLDTCYFDIASIARLIKLKCLDQIFIRFDYLDSARVDWFQVQGSDNEYRRSNTCPYTVTAAENDYVQQCLVDNLSKKCVVTYRCSQIPNAFDILAPLYPILQLSHGQQKNAV
jgi:hypothetical protein